MARRRTRGIFDPDYRRKGWNKSALAPKNSDINITQLAIMPPFAVAVYLYTYHLPALFNFPAALSIWGGLLLLWLVSALIIRRFMWQRVQRQLSAAAPPASGDHDHDSTPASRDRDRDRDRARTPSGRTPAVTATVAVDASADTLSPRDFEHEVAWLFNTLTRYKAIVSGGAGDGGVDVKIFNRDEQLIGIVQCKRYQPDRALPPAHLRELNTVKQQHQVQYAWLATTARFSEDTRREARRLNIHLLDGARLHRMQKEARARARTHGTRPA